MPSSLDYIFKLGVEAGQEDDSADKYPKRCPPSQNSTLYKEIPFFYSRHENKEKKSFLQDVFSFVCFDVCILSRLSRLNGKSDCRSHSPKSIRKEQISPKEISSLRLQSSNDLNSEFLLFYSCFNEIMFPYL
jgi:hypothetical protein